MQPSPGRFTLIGCLFLAVAAAERVPVAQAQVGHAINWKEHFLTEGPKAWARYYAHASRLQGAESLRATVLQPQRQVRLEMTMEFKQAPGCALMVIQNALIVGKPNTQGQLRAINRQYQFRLERSTQSSPWVITETSKEATRGGVSAQHSASTIDEVKAALAAPVAINYNLEDDWPHIVTSAHLTLLSIVPIQKEETKLVQVDFEMSWAPSNANLVRLKGGRVWFDPERCWVMRKYDCKFEQFRGEKKAPTTLSQSVSYDYEDGDEMPLLKRMVKQHISSKGEKGPEEIREYRLRVEDISERQFTLAAFGFPEPFSQNSRWYLWMIGAGIVTGGLTLWFRRKALVVRSPLAGANPRLQGPDVNGPSR